MAVVSLRRSVVALMTAISRIQDPHRAFVLATEDAELLLALRGDMSHHRAHQVERMWAVETTTLDVLADQIGISKQRAGQFLKEARDGQGRAL